VLRQLLLQSRFGVGANLVFALFLLSCSPVFAQPGIPPNPPPPPAVVLRSTASGIGTTAKPTDAGQSSDPYAPRSGKRFLPTFWRLPKSRSPVGASPDGFSV